MSNIKLLFTAKFIWFYTTLVWFVVFSLTGCGEPEEGSMCIRNEKFDKVDLGLTYITQENCYGYQFLLAEHIRYSSDNNRPESQVEVILSDKHSH